MTDPHDHPHQMPGRWPRVVFEAHPTGKQLVDYVDGLLGEGDAAQVHEHVVFCPECASGVEACRREVGLSTGFDPISGERVHAGLRFEVARLAREIERLSGLSQSRLPDVGEHFAQAADDEHSPVVREKFSRDDVEVTLSVLNGLMRAVVTSAAGPVVAAEVRLELTDPDDEQFELYAWGTTNQHGLAELGPTRSFTSFATGHRFTLAVLLPEALRT